MELCDFKDSLLYRISSRRARDKWNPAFKVNNKAVNSYGELSRHPDSCAKESPNCTVSLMFLLLGIKIWKVSWETMRAPVSCQPVLKFSKDGRNCRGTCLQEYWRFQDGHHLLTVLHKLRYKGTYLLIPTLQQIQPHQDSLEVLHGIAVGRSSSHFFI